LYINYDFLGCSISDDCTLKTLLASSNEKIQISTAILLNILASDASGTSYIIQNDHNIQILIDILYKEVLFIRKKILLSEGIHLASFKNVHYEEKYRIF